MRPAISSAMRRFALLAAFTLALSSGARAAAPPRIADDYPRALAEARRLGVPLLVDVWAPW